MKCIAITVLVGSMLAACSAQVPVAHTSSVPHKYAAPNRDKAWIDPPEVGPNPGAPRPAGLD
ncbi:MAG: hypothetical protein JO227_15525 [Acetobacteraceae bacterium]|nr:hypothetical protein [Acetobacteraceae bacterium]